MSDKHVSVEDSPRPTTIADIAIGMLFILLPSAVILTLDVIAGFNIWRQHRTEVYVPVTGLVVDIAEANRSGVIAYKVSYSYSVGGKTFTASRCRYGQTIPTLDGTAYVNDASRQVLWAKSRVEADELLKKYKKGNEVIVFVNSTDSSDSVLIVGLDGMDIGIASQLLSFTLFLATAWWSIIRRCVSRLDPMAGLVKPAGEQKVRIQLYSWIDRWPIRAVFSTAVVLLVTVAVSLLSLGDHPPLWGVIGILATSGCVGVVLSIVLAVMIRGGAALEVDKREGEIWLRWWPKGFRRRRVLIGDIAGIEIVPTGQDLRFAWVVMAYIGREIREPIVIATYSRRGEAERVVDVCRSYGIGVAQ